MKILILLFSLFAAECVLACPDFTGIYGGTCSVIFQGTETIRDMPIGLVQSGCDKFNFNDLTENYYTLDKFSLYIDGEKKILRRASTAEDGNVVYLHQTVEKKSTKYGDALSVSSFVFKKIDSNTISYEGETFNLLAGEVSVTTSCPNLKK